MTDQPTNIMRGEFTVINSRVLVRAPNATATHALAAIHQQMVLELSVLNVPRIHVDPQPEEFEDTADYIVRATQIMDRWLAAVGAEVKANAVTRVDLTRFEDQFVCAVSGNATFECDRAAYAQREERDEYVGETNYRRTMRAVFDALEGE